jgi:formylglycine-generating enzyme required for sulfatase activity
MTDPQAYLKSLQAAETEQGMAKLRTLVLEFSPLLARLPALRQEIDSLLQGHSGVHYAELVERVEAQLTQANELVFELDLLPAALRNQPELTAFAQTVTQTLTLRTVVLLVKKFHSLCAEIKQAQAEAERREQLAAEQKARAAAQAQAEAAQKTKQEAEQKAKQAAAEARRKQAVPELLIVPAGKFMMGGVKGRDDVEEGITSWELPAHEVTLPSFALGKYPVTFEQFDIFCAETGFAKPNDQGWGRGKRPVMNVSWDDALAYCAWLSDLTGQRYRLPSEAEWEYAARANSNTAFPWGQQIDGSRANYGKMIGRTTPVDEYPANAFGLYDMQGNVWEWCQDAWHDNYQGAPNNGSVWAGGGNRVLRGGSWYFNPQNSRAAYRFSFTPAVRVNSVGFRLARTLP